MTKKRSVPQKKSAAKAPAAQPPVASTPVAKAPSRYAAYEPMFHEINIRGTRVELLDDCMPTVGSAYRGRCAGAEFQIGSIFESCLAEDYKRSAAAVQALDPRLPSDDIWDRFAESALYAFEAAADAVGSRPASLISGRCLSPAPWPLLFFYVLRRAVDRLESYDNPRELLTHFARNRARLGKSAAMAEYRRLRPSTSWLVRSEEVDDYELGHVGATLIEFLIRHPDFSDDAACAFQSLAGKWSFATGLAVVPESREFLGNIVAELFSMPIGRSQLPPAVVELLSLASPSFLSGIVQSARDGEPLAAAAVDALFLAAAKPKLSLDDTRALDVAFSGIALALSPSAIRRCEARDPGVLARRMESGLKIRLESGSLPELLEALKERAGYGGAWRGLWAAKCLGNFDFFDPSRSEAENLAKIRSVFASIIQLALSASTRPKAALHAQA